MIKVIAANACADHSVLELVTPPQQLEVDQLVVYSASIRDAFGNARTEGAQLSNAHSALFSQENESCSFFL